jgi:cysteine synthase A
MKYNNVLETVGNTPIVRLQRIGAELPVELWVKLERANPAGSVKDRPALNMIEDAERRGVLKPGDTFIEPTSGNTGIGLAMVAAVKGYKAVFTMAEDMSDERKLILQAYGARLILTPADRGTSGAIEIAQQLAKEHGWFFVGQHFNPANPAAHRQTADEVWADFGTELHGLICTTGTGGTITGMSRYLRERHPKLRMIATEPAESPILSKGIGGKHKIMGTAPAFIPEILDQTSYDEVIPVTAEEAYAATRHLAEWEGILSGISCGAAVAGMLKFAGRDECAGRKLLAMLPDTGERYLSTDLWADLPSAEFHS